MPLRKATSADTIRILVSTDNHVGYNERDPVRGDDSWKSFDEVMSLAKERDVDMVLLAGDLFHDNKPSRKAMYEVMRSLRTYCYGDKPCELEMLSDGSEHFAGAFNHVNYADEDINVAIPVFSIHGNHDDPSGEGHLAALDILAMSGMINYYGRTPEADNIEIKPVVLRKGETKVALYGMSNIRDERLFRTFRDGKVKFYQPSSGTDDMYNIMSVHQNHSAYTETSYLPEQFLPDFMDLIVWGHEHKCEIDPQTNPEMGFKVMQPGSTVATSLVPGEAVPKHVAILSISEGHCGFEKIRLKSVRPFLMQEIVLRNFDEMQDIAFRAENRTRITRFLSAKVEEMITQANDEWYALQHENGGEIDEDEGPPKPIIRLRVECTPPDGGKFEVENAQRFSGRFADKVANATDVVQFHRKKTTTRASKKQPDMPEEEIMAQLSIESVKVDKLVKEFLTAQSLTILPQNRFSDAVSQFVDKDDKHAMEEFLKDSLNLQRSVLMQDSQGDRGDAEDVDRDDERVQEGIEHERLRQEQAHASGELKMRRKKGTVRPRPDDWDSDTNGPWEQSIMSVVLDQDQLHDGADASPAPPAFARAGTRGGRGGRTSAAPTNTRKVAAPAAAKASTRTPASRSRNQQPEDDDEDEDDDADDVIMLDDDDDIDKEAEAEEEEEEESQGLFVRQTPSTRGTRAQPRPDAASRAKPAPRSRGRGPGSLAGARGGSGGGGRQTQLRFSGSQAPGSMSTRQPGPSRSLPTSSSRRHEPIEDEISDDDEDDAFEPPPPSTAASRSRRR